MKLEAVNGNSISLNLKEELDEPLAGMITTANGANGQEEEVEEAVVEEQQPESEKEVGKKKGARKKRSLNWEEAERGLLLEVIKPKVDFVENRSVDAKSIKAKRLAWMQITKQFNALNFRHRSLEQIQVQWRSMKNSGKREHQQKHPKSTPLEGMELIEFMEELQKDPVSVRSQTRGGGGGILIKKELIEMDDEDTPLAALPTSTSTSDDTLQASTMAALPSPPPSAESQNETQQATPTRNRKKARQSTAPKQQPQVLPPTVKPKRQRSQNSTHSDVVAAATITPISADCVQVPSSTQLPLASTLPTPPTSPPAPVDEKYKKQLYELLKRARLAEMDYARREHEQKLRFEQTEQELKLNYYRQQEELKLKQQREEHETRMRHFQAEHEARMSTYNAKNDHNTDGKAFD